MSLSISAVSLKQLMNDEPSLVIIDVLPADPFREAHLPTAENICVYESAFVYKVLEAHKERANVTKN
jgi:rhodanese-related sulfurtransferase